MPEPAARPPGQKRQDFRIQSVAPARPSAGIVRFYVNDDADLVRIEADGTETVIGGAGEVSAAIDAHEEAANPHPQYVEAG